MDPIGVISPSEATKSHLRSREESETEPGFYLLEDNSFSCHQQVRLRSLVSYNNTTITFCNQSEVPSVAVWIDFEGHELSTHKFWPADFRAVVRLLLLSHARASTESDPASMQEDESCDRMEIESAASLESDGSSHEGNEIEMHLGTTQQQNTAITDALFSSFKGLTPGVQNGSNYADLLKLPLDVVKIIICTMAPEMKQHFSDDPAAFPDMQPALLPSDPTTWGPPISAIANEEH
eukprot:gene21156-28045_t